MSGRYARALFELAVDSGQVDKVESDLSSFKALLHESEDLTRLVKSPVFSADDQENALTAVLSKTDFAELSKNFFSLIARNRRLFAVEHMISDFTALLANHRGEVTAYVSTASELNEEQLSALKDSLQKSVGQNIRVEADVDPSLLGGLVVKVGSRMIDNSIRTKLDSIKNAMKEVG